jgi:hypothetical protein
VKIFAPDFMKGTEREAFCENFLKGILNKDCSFEIKI